VSPTIQNPPESPFAKGGLREFGGQGVEGWYGDSAFLDSRFPASARTGPVFTRTSFAGMTEESVRLRRTGSFGVSPKSFYLPPKSGGSEGVESIWASCVVR
jgi:hypothetical protein